MGDASLIKLLDGNDKKLANLEMIQLFFLDAGKDSVSGCERAIRKAKVSKVSGENRPTVTSACGRHLKTKSTEAHLLFSLCALLHFLHRTHSLLFPISQTHHYKHTTKRRFLQEQRSGNSEGQWRKRERENAPNE